ARWVGRQGKPKVIISVSPHKMPDKPFKLYISPFRVDQDSEFRRIKTISYVIHAAALNQAKKKKCDDALLLNERGRVAEVTSANIFWVQRGRIFTPPLSSGCLDGITRRIMMRQAAKLGHDVTERSVSLDQLLKADELFISSSLKLVIGVGSLRKESGTTLFHIGPITTELRERFNSLIGL
ncbi:MAG: aminotransferase class IV, partial [bacterium]|nr:aminotransferase class IV [bacterium]